MQNLQCKFTMQIYNANLQYKIYNSDVNPNIRFSQNITFTT